MHKPKFTFCIPNLNKVEYLPACIESMLAQDCEDWRCVFVDGHSTDGSWEYMQQFASDPRFLLRRGIKQGMYADWNECLRYVETEYFYFLTSDDTCFPTLISETTKLLDEHSDVDACHFQFAMIDSAGEIIRTYDDIIQKEIDFYADVYQYKHRRSGLCEFFLHFSYKTLYRTITSLVFRSTLIPKMHGFSTQYGAVGDYDWTMRLGLFTDILYLPSLLATWRIYEGQATQDSESLTSLKKLLDISINNLSGFSDLIKESLRSKKEIIAEKVTEKLFDEYVFRLYQSIPKNQPLLRLIGCYYEFLRKYPLFPIQRVRGKLYGLMTQGSLKYCLPAKAIATSVIHDYSLPWPPIQIHD